MSDGDGCGGDCGVIVDSRKRDVRIIYIVDKARIGLMMTRVCDECLEMSDVILIVEIYVIIFLLLKFWFRRESNLDHRRHRVYTLYLKVSKIPKHL